MSVGKVDDSESGGPWFKSWTIIWNHLLLLLDKALPLVVLDNDCPSVTRLWVWHVKGFDNRLNFNFRYPYFSKHMNRASWYTAFLSNLNQLSRTAAHNTCYVENRKYLQQRIVYHKTHIYMGLILEHFYRS